MRNNKDEATSTRSWAEFRFTVIGRLLTAPPPKGELQNELQKLAEITWKHPITKERRKFAFSTIEAWYYIALNEKMLPVESLRRKIRSDYGQFRSMNDDIKGACVQQYKDHPTWSYNLHADNLKALNEQTPSRSSIRRFMRSNGLFKRRKVKNKRPNQIIAENRFEDREVRSFETDFVSGLGLEI